MKSLGPHGQQRFSSAGLGIVLLSKGHVNIWSTKTRLEVGRSSLHAEFAGENEPDPELRASPSITHKLSEY